MAEEIIKQPEPLHPLRVWTDVDGARWACAAYDHGPFCRLCQRCDETLDSLIQNVRDGFAVARTRDGDGMLMFKITTKGKAKVEDLIGSDPEHAQLWADLQNLPDHPKDGQTG